MCLIGWVPTFLVLSLTCEGFMCLIGWVPTFLVLSPKIKLVLGGGVEPPRLSAHAPQTCVSAIPPPEQGNWKASGKIPAPKPWRKRELAEGFLGFPAGTPGPLPQPLDFQG